MKKISLLLLLGSVATVSFAQDIDKILNAKEVERIERTLSSDAMEGRATFSPGIDRAAAFIADEFKKAGLQTWNNSGTFIQKIPNMIGKASSVSVTIDGAPFDPKNVIVTSGKASVKVDETSGLQKIIIPKGANFNTELRNISIANTKSCFVIVDTSYAPLFRRMQAGGRASMASDRVVVYVLTATDPQKYSVEATFTEMPLQNVLGVLPGKSKKNEYVIFSGHYDHLGIRGGKDRDGKVITDSIFNGANDDAAGTTAVIMLAKYFKALNNNERTLIFCAFTGEEVGGYGASYFSKQFKPEDVKAMFNIEMIGTESKWGTNSAYITGYERTDMGKIYRAISMEQVLLSILIHTPKKIFSSVLITQRLQGLAFLRTPSLLQKWTTNPTTTKPAMRSAHSIWKTWHAS
jgi:hypothetical protein